MNGKEKKMKDERFLGSLYGHGTGYAGAVWDKNSISPTLTTMQGGGREPHIMEVKEVFIKQATNDGYIPCEIGGGGEPIISIKRNTKRKGTRERTDMSNTDNGEYP